MVWQYRQHFYIIPYCTFFAVIHFPLGTQKNIYILRRRKINLAFTDDIKKHEQCWKKNTKLTKEIYTYMYIMKMWFWKVNIQPIFLTKNKINQKLLILKLRNGFALCKKLISQKKVFSNLYFLQRNMYIPAITCCWMLVELSTNSQMKLISLELQEKYKKLVFFPTKQFHES